MSAGRAVVVVKKKDDGETSDCSCFRETKRRPGCSSLSQGARKLAQNELGPPVVQMLAQR
jgi:hypothetical protein